MATGGRYGAISVIAVGAVLSTLGPYIGPGVRIEQAAIYIAAALLLPQLITRRISSGVGAITFAWVAIAAITVLVTLTFPGRSISEGFPGIDAVLLPMATMILAIVVTAGRDASSNVLLVQKATIICMSANAVLSIAMLFLEELADFIERYYWSTGAGVENSVAARVYGVGRIIGVFHSPFTAGGAYAVALLITVCLMLERRVSTPIGTSAATLIIAGGSLTQSKLFIFVGLPLAALVFLLNRKVSVRGIVSVLLVLGAVMFMAQQATEWASGAAGRMYVLQENSDGITDLLTAGRLSQDSAIGSVMSEAVQVSPIYGLGSFGAELGPLDTSWTEVIARAGIVGVIIFGAMFFLAGFRIFTNRANSSRGEFLLAASLLLLWLAASFGGPTITANRFGTILVLNLWLVMSMPYVTGGARGSARVESARNSSNRLLG